MDFIRFNVGDKLQLKKKHPCGGSSFTVLRLGSDVRIRCDQCGRDMLQAREKLEKAIKIVLTQN